MLEGRGREGSSSARAAYLGRVLGLSPRGVPETSTMHWSPTVSKTLARGLQQRTATWLRGRLSRRRGDHQRRVASANRAGHLPRRQSGEPEGPGTHPSLLRGIWELHEVDVEDIRA